MDDFESKLGSILNNPEMMGRIMQMAQNLGAQPPAPEPPPPEPPPMPEIDFATIQKLSGLMGSAGVDTEQKALLNALTPYISAERISKLERAMRAAKLAGVATSFLGSSSHLFGR